MGSRNSVGRRRTIMIIFGHAKGGALNARRASPGLSRSACVARPGAACPSLQRHGPAKPSAPKTLYIKFADRPFAHQAGLT